MRSYRPGEELQRLVRLLELSVGDTGNIEVSSPRMLKDRDTGQMREHDVVVEITSGHHKLLVALECRDRSRKVSVPEVEAFADKCRATGVDQGILVSTKGFAETALSKARSRSIRCLTFDEVDRLDWMTTNSISMISRKITGVFLQLGFDGAKPTQATGLRVMLDATQEFDRQAALNTARQALDHLVPQMHEPEGPRETWFNVEIDESNRPIARDTEGNEFTVARAMIKVSYAVAIEQRPFLFGRYDDKTAGTEITQAAIATLEVQGQQGSLVVVSNLDGTKSVKLVFDPKEPQA
jgi:hypothetical protein